MRREINKNLKRKEGRNVLFNGVLNSFYYGYIGFGYMANNHRDNETGNPLPLLRGLLFSFNCKGIFYKHHPIERITHTTVFGITVVEHDIFGRNDNDRCA